ncbi:elongation factor G [Portibacter marinus]|uniref:elongation factor G n=1 Tax=Portibacter marinus TaxID=2898660 RepID=UPI001F15FE29|nr:elongation factor G [Portibacter marinus]
MSFESKNIRNVALLGHSGCGKTTFAETMLFEAKEIPRRGTIEAGSTVSDYTNIEKEKGNSIFSTLMHAKWKDSKINIIDTPGLDDFVGEVISSLKVADTSVMMLNAAAGVEVGTEILWEYTLKMNTPTIFVVNQIDHEKSDFDATLEQAINRFGTNVIPFQYPLNQGYGFDSIIDALRMVMYVFPVGGGKPEKQPIPDSELAKAKEMHNALVEAAAENDETLMERYFEVGTLNEDELASGLRIALANQEIFPVFCCSALMNKGSGRIMGFINDICPSPADRPPARLEGGGVLECNSSGDPTVFIYKTLSEPQVGMVSYFKVYSGIIKPGDEFVNNENRTSERISQISVSNGKIRDNVNELRAGDLGMTVKLKDTHSNDTLTNKGNEDIIEKIDFPSPRIRAAIKPPGKNDMEKLMKALHTIEEEDPTLIIEQSRQLKQTILHAQGQLHMDIIKYRIEKVNGITMEFERPKIPYRETIQKMAQDSYRHKKQSGGSGQFGEVHMRIEPYYEGMPEPDGLNVRSKEIEELPWGGTLAFYWCIVGGSIDSKYSNAIKKGVMSKMEEGPLTGSYCQDIRVCIYDGKMHAVDSNDMAFMIASTMVFKKNFENASPQLLEPIYDLEILCSDTVMGDVMSDLQTRRAIIQGMDTEGHYQKIMAKVPLAELYKYSSSLRSITQGRAKFTRSFAEYAPVPHEIQKELVMAYKSELETA